MNKKEMNAANPKWYSSRKYLVHHNGGAQKLHPKLTIPEELLLSGYSTNEILVFTTMLSFAREEDGKLLVSFIYKELGTYLSINKNTISDCIKSLCNHGLVEKKSCGRSPSTYEILQDFGRKKSPMGTTD